MRGDEHILFITPGFPKDEKDDQCIPPLQQYLLNLQSRYPDLLLSVIALQYPFTSKEYEWNGIRVYPCHSGPSPWTNPIKWTKAYSRARSLHRRQKIDILHSFWLTEATLVGQFLARSFRLRLMSTVMGQDARESNKYLRLIDFSKLSLICLTEQTRLELNQRGISHPVEIIPWGVEEVVKGDDWDDRSIDVLMVGSLVDVKNYPKALRVIKILVTQIGVVNIEVVGCGKQKARLETLIVDLGLNGVVTLRGALPRIQVLEQMEKSKVLLHTSSYEGQGYVFQEALSRGMRIVSTEAGAIPSPYWVVSESDESLALGIADQLTKGDVTGFSCTRIADTTDAYLKLYFKQPRLPLRENSSA